MSVLQIPVRVTRTLIAPTVTVLIVVLVNKDSLEMERFAKVNERTFINYLNVAFNLNLIYAGFSIK